MNDGRTRLLAKTLGHLLMSEARSSLNNGSRPVRRATEIRAAFENLGPFYIKVGQILSTRPDFVSAETIKELGTLHDQVPATPFQDFEEVLADELGARWRRLFRRIDTDQPLGSASLAQVYRATLADGTLAAVKVQRPGIQPVIGADMATLRRASRVLIRMRPRFNAVIDVRAMLDLIFEAMAGELDFTVEARNMDVARRAVEDFDHLSVPAVLVATPRVLVQGLAPGRSIRDVGRHEFTDHERLAIAHDLLAYMYRSYFVDRTFHADPHPGNIFVAPGHGAALIDWGMIGRLDRPLSLKLALTLINIVQNDGDGAAKAWIEMGKSTQWADVNGFSGDVSALVPKVATATLEELNFGITLTNVLRQSTRRGIKTNPMIPLLGKSFANMEGSIRCLAPELSAAEVFRDELADVMVDLACEMLSETQAARVVMELMLTSNSSYNHARGLIRDLANRELQIPVESKNLRTKNPMTSRVAIGALAVAGYRWFHRSSATQRKHKSRSAPGMLRRATRSTSRHQW
jgi:ubiquinone biosynthesis protein